MTDLFNIENIALTVAGYSISYVELIGTIFGFISVYLATRANILTWATGIVNELFLFLLFFQVQLYADMFLQVYFFAATIYGWYNWKRQPEHAGVNGTTKKGAAFIIISLVAGTLAAGALFSNIHVYLPEFFKIKAAYPLIDSFIMVSSIIATILLAKRNIETWYLWILLDLVCVLLYFKKGIYFLSFEYFVFWGLAVYGFYNWKRLLKHD